MTVSESFQLQGNGTSYGSFRWSSRPIAPTFGDRNFAQVRRT